MDQNQMDQDQTDQTQTDQPQTNQPTTVVIQEYARRPLVTGIGGLVVGLIVGLVVLGWWLWPVQWYDAAPSNLQSDYQDWWMQMSIISYGATGDAATAKLRI